ncbi:hypothetical protein TNCV_3458851 [Trichonephila clavipes]|nr:hypothetical protein TNCV_3458821 [Trichonephila clavipes]GFU36409.1 hypothetical protein TNCV_3458851 [Trichonephila clavipes]
MSLNSPQTAGPISMKVFVCPSGTREWFTFVIRSRNVLFNSFTSCRSWIRQTALRSQYRISSTLNLQQYTLGGKVSPSSPSFLPLVSEGGPTTPGERHAALTTASPVSLRLRLAI